MGTEAAWVAAGQAVAAVGTLVGVRLLTEAMSPTSYGELSLGMTLAILAHQVVWAPLAGGLLRFYSPASEAEEVGSFLVAARFLVLRAAAAVLLLGSLAGVALVLAGEQRALPLLFAALLFSWFSGSETALGSMQNAARQRTVVAWHDGLATWLRFLAAVLLVTTVSTLSWAAMTGYALASALVFCSQAWFFRRITKGVASGTQAQVSAWRDRMVAYAWPFAAWGTFTWAQVASDRWSLQAFTSTSEVGLYAVVYQLGFYPALVASAFLMQLMAPVIYSRAGDATDADRVRAARRLNIIVVAVVAAATFVGTAMAWLLHAQVFELFADARYRSVSSLLPWMVLAGGLFACGQAASLLLMAGVGTRRLLYPKIFTAVIGVSATVVGARVWGIEGVVGSEILFSVVFGGWIGWLGLTFRANSVAPAGTAVGSS